MKEGDIIEAEKGGERNGKGKSENAMCGDD